MPRNTPLCHSIRQADKRSYQYSERACHPRSLPGSRRSLSNCQDDRIQQEADHGEFACSGRKSLWLKNIRLEVHNALLGQVYRLCIGASLASCRIQWTRDRVSLINYWTIPRSPTQFISQAESRSVSTGGEWWIAPPRMLAPQLN